MADNVMIVGAGPVGLVLALALQQHDMPVKVLEAREKIDAYQDGRTLALSYGTKLVLEKLNVWERLVSDVTMIQTIHISQRGGFGRTVLRANEHGLPALGYVVSYGVLMQALHQVINDHDVIYQSPVIAVNPSSTGTQIVTSSLDKQAVYHSPLAVIADGGRSLDDLAILARETKHYGHDALVSKVACELPHDGVAYERFTPSGAMALLPKGPRDFALVWTGDQTDIRNLLDMDEHSFLAALHLAFGDRVGRFLSIEERKSFPLKLSTLKSTDYPHMVVIGNAAQTMHPVAGQGFNVGIRDAWALAQLVINTPPSEWGAHSMLHDYQQQRKRDTQNGLMFTDFLVNVFTNDVLGVSALRGAGLSLLDSFLPAKRFLVNKMSFGR